MNSLSPDTLPISKNSVIDDIKKSILDKIEQKNRQMIADSTTPADKEVGETSSVKPSRRKPKRSIKDDPQRLNRTLFVGNVPSKCCTDKQMQRELKAIFSSQGPVESLRFRSLALAEAMPRKHAFISGQLNERIGSNNAYVVMEKEEDAQKCLMENSRQFHGHHLRVDIAGSSGKLPSHKKSVFVGNLPLDVSDEAVWKAFADCGAVTSVRIIRDKTTGMGKGFAYVAFKDRATVKMGLLMDGTEVSGRKIRVQKCSKPGEEAKPVDGKKKAFGKAGERNFGNSERPKHKKPSIVKRKP